MSSDAASRRAPRRDTTTWRIASRHPEATPGHGSFRVAPQGRTPWLLIAVLVASSLLANAPAAEARAWKTLLTRHAIIFFEDDADLAALEQHLEIDPITLRTQQITGAAPVEAGEHTQLAQKIDYVFERVQVVLDMRQNMPRVQIRVFDGELIVEEVCPQCRHRYLYGDNPRSWYVYEQKSIYLTIQDIRVGILAHEVAHHVIDHFFAVRPDPQSSEILAVFAEKNFFD